MWTDLPVQSLISFKPSPKIFIYNQKWIIANIDWENNFRFWGDFNRAWLPDSFYLSKLFGCWRFHWSIREASKSHDQTTIQSFANFLEWCCLCPCPNMRSSLVNDHSQWIIYCSVANQSFEWFLNAQFPWISKCLVADRLVDHSVQNPGSLLPIFDHSFSFSNICQSLQICPTILDW